MNLNRKVQELLLLLVSICLTVLVSLALVRWLAPGLLGINGDMVLVQSAKELQPFYENIFRQEHKPGNINAGGSREPFDFFLQDPFVKTRAKPLLPDIGGAGPNDLLGFRNHAVPNKADVIAIGDSQTYGNNAIIWKNWPHNLQLLLPGGNSVYSMATGGWAAPQYYYAFQKSLFFSPKVIVIAFYTGNDPLETYSFAIATDLWKEFLPDRDISDYGTPLTYFPPREEEHWQVKFSDGTETVFTPKLRHSSNVEHPAIDAAYEIMFNVAAKIAETASEIEDLHVIFTIIPTKEFVYYEKVVQDNLDIDPDYQALIRDEGRRIDAFSAGLEKLEGATYVDVIQVLQISALKSDALYPADINGHPLATGYNVIATALAPVVSQYLSAMEDGFFYSRTNSGMQRLVYIEAGRFWLIANPEESLFDEPAATLDSSRLANLGFAGHLYLDKKPR